MAEPFTVTVYDKAFNRRGWVGGWESLTATVRHNATDTCVMTVRTGHPRIADLMEPGARLVVEYEDAFLLSGPVWRRSGTLSPGEGTVTFTVESDFRLLSFLLGWPNPAADLTQQGADDAYYTAAGVAETVAKQIIGVNVARWVGAPITVAPTLGRGSEISVQIRMHPVIERLMPLVDQAGIGLSVRQSGPGLVVDAYTPTVRSRIITAASGLLVNSEWEQAGPQNTRVVVGGQGEGVDRAFMLLADSTREAEWGTRLEVFRDARDAETADILAVRAQETLTEGQPTSGLSITLAETATFRYGRTFNVGDQVTIELADNQAVTDLVREVTIVDTPGEGILVVPAVGKRADDPTRVLAEAIQRVAAKVRDLAAGR